MTVVLTAAGAAVATIVEIAATYIAMITTLYSKFGLPVGAIYSAIAGGPIWRELVETLLAYAVLIWPLAAWRLPLVGSIGGLVVLQGVLFTVAGGGRIQIAMVLLSIVGMFVIVLLRAFDWAHKRFGGETT
ncbi:MAG: hypothetical protein WDM86_06905 [Rhizomicrobium sp.]